MMKFFVYLLLACCAASCHDSNTYYIVERPADEPLRTAKAFNVYWNVPTMQCKSKKVLFENLYEKYGIIQNKNDDFLGDKINILYDPGVFPAIFEEESSGKYKLRNGGVPQEGDLQLHLKKFREDVDEKIPDANFSGIGIIDFESWRPVFRQNFGALVPYKNLSYEIEKKLHPWWPRAWIESDAKRRFEEAGRKFMQTTLSVAKQMRPYAKWGYYGFPYCFNMAEKTMAETCSSEVRKENDQSYWLWSESTALYPSVYRAHDITTSQLAAMVRGRVDEAARVRRPSSDILPYFWFRYRDGGFLTEADLSAVLKTFYKSDASGFLIWGSSNDVNTVEKCEALLKYVEKIFGPAIASYTKRNIQNDEYDETSEESNITETNDFTTETLDTTTITKLDTSYMTGALNYQEQKDEVTNTEELPSDFGEQLLNKGNSLANANKLDIHNYNASIMFDILMGTYGVPTQVPNNNDERDYSYEYATSSNNNDTELIENSYSTTDSNISFASIESSERNFETNETSKEFMSPYNSSEETNLFALDNIDPKDEYLILYNGKKSFIGVETSTNFSSEDSISTESESNTKEYIEYTTEKTLDTRLFTEH